MADKNKAKDSMKMDTKFIEVLKYSENDGSNHSNDFGFGIWKKSTTSYSQSNALWFGGLHVGSGESGMTITNTTHSPYDKFWDDVTPYGDHTGLNKATTGITSLSKGLGARLSAKKLEEILSGMNDDDEIVVGFFSPCTTYSEGTGLPHLKVKVDDREYFGDLADNGTDLGVNDKGMMYKTLKVKDVLGSNQFVKIKIGNDGSLGGTVTPPQSNSVVKDINITVKHSDFDALKVSSSSIVTVKFATSESGLSSSTNTITGTDLTITPGNTEAKIVISATTLNDKFSTWGYTKDTKLYYSITLSGNLSGGDTTIENSSNRYGVINAGALYAGGSGAGDVWWYRNVILRFDDSGTVSTKQITCLGGYVKFTMYHSYAKYTPHLSFPAEVYGQFLPALTGSSYGSDTSYGKNEFTVFLTDNPDNERNLFIKIKDYTWKLNEDVGLILQLENKRYNFYVKVTPQPLQTVTPNYYAVRKSTSTGFLTTGEWQYGNDSMYYPYNLFESDIDGSQHYSGFEVRSDETMFESITTFKEGHFKFAESTTLLDNYSVSGQFDVDSNGGISNIQITFKNYVENSYGYPDGRIVKLRVTRDFVDGKELSIWIDLQG